MGDGLGWAGRRSSLYVNMGLQKAFQIQARSDDQTFLVKCRRLSLGDAVI